MCNRIIPILSLVIFFSVGCEQPTSKTVSTEAATISDRVVKKPEEGVKSSSGRDYTHKRGSALSILNHRITEDKNEFYSIIEDGIWQYQFIHDGEKMIKPEAFDREYLDFKTDLTYEKGKAGKVIETGKYHYDFSKDQVLMVPDDATLNPQEWKTMFKSDAFVILVGTAEYGNNNFQMKLERRKSLDEL